jgi:hypothetical protein
MLNERDNGGKVERHHHHLIERDNGGKVERHHHHLIEGDNGVKGPGKILHCCTVWKGGERDGRKS